MKFSSHGVLLAATLACGCQSTKSSRAPVGGDAPTQEPSTAGKGADASPETGDDDGRLIVTGDGEGPVDANGCTPAFDFHALRGHAIVVDTKRTLWVFAGTAAERSAGISTCVEGKFAFTPIKPFGALGDVPGPPWGSQGQIFVPLYAGDEEVVYVIQNPAEDAGSWQIEKRSLALPGPVVGTAVASPDVMLFVEKELQQLALYKTSEDATAATVPVPAALPEKPLRGLTVRADYQSGQWLAVFSTAEGTMISRAAELVGPWSAAAKVHADADGLACNEATELPMFAPDLSSETLIAYSCADSLPLHIVRVPLPKD